ncbi:tail fiber domain-containing protein [Labrys sp. LIt4]|uniref:tail fiber domain-containing protein n=1 Tax=Labrys sp. LIt4 TaxID=2821355 RepID=UPI001ADECD20|nr:tail fiber domain-containing protein [Labrys sp. LIt4]MBP0580472.1 tail fiber domain-containing protein [Labrys sp. LIt4]
MTSKFEVRRGLLFGVLGSGLAVVLASCASGYPDEPVYVDEPEPPRRKMRSTRPHYKPMSHRRRVIVEPDADDRMPGGSNGGGGGGGGGGGNGGGGSSGGGGGWSDRRLKTDIRAIGQSPSGLTIYRFRYVWGGPVYVGVMAQDLLETHPDAVILTDSGYFMVDYDRIDVKMTMLADYQRSAPLLGRGA